MKNNEKYKRNKRRINNCFRTSYKIIRRSESNKRKDNKNTELFLNNEKNL